MINVIVTGANGLVGKFVANKLSQLDKIHVVAQYRNHLTVDNSISNIYFEEIDLASEHAITKLSSFSPKIIVHCAAQIPTDLIGNEECAHANRKIDNNIFIVAAKFQSKVIFISSAAIYENSASPWSESISVSPSTNYAKEKLISELSFSKLPVLSTSLRITSPYGGIQKPDRNVLYKFIHAAISDQSLSIYGTGARCQNFIYAGDIADAIKMIVSSFLGGYNISGIFNIAGDSSISMIDLAKLIIKVSGKGDIMVLENSHDEVFKNPRIDLSKAKEIIGWMPATEIDVGIGELINIITN